MINDIQVEIASDVSICNIRLITVTPFTLLGRSVASQGLKKGLKFSKNRKCSRKVSESIS